MRTSRFEQFCTVFAILMMVGGGLFGLYVAAFVHQMDNHVGLGLGLAIVCGLTTLMATFDLKRQRRVSRSIRGDRR